MTTDYWRVDFTGLTIMGKERGGSLFLQQQADGLRGVLQLEAFNAAIHPVVGRLLEQKAGRDCYALQLELQPDLFQPKARRPVSCQMQLSVSTDPTATATAWVTVAGVAGVDGTDEPEVECTLQVHSSAPVEQLQLTAVFHARDEKVDEPFLDIRLQIHDGLVTSAAIGKSFRGAAAQFTDCELLESQSTHLRLRCATTAILDEPDADWPEHCDVIFELITVADFCAGTIRLADVPGYQAGCWGRQQSERQGLWTASDWSVPWFAAQLDHKPVAPAEHPRLLFRARDVPGLRQRAGTEVGKAIIKRLRHVLGADGEVMPQVFNPHPVVGQNAQGNDLPRGAFTAWHCTGYATLFILTDEQRYADMAQACIEHLWAGQPNRDERYAWCGQAQGDGSFTRVGGLRIGAVFTAVALAYDLCYAAWSADFRQQVVDKFLRYDDADPEQRWSMERLLGANGYPPGSNHYGAYIGGQGLAALAIQGDPGADEERVADWLQAAHRGIVRNLSYGFGDHGGFSEGHHPSRLSANSGFLTFLQAMQTTKGRDYLATRPAASWITLRWIMLLTTWNGLPAFPHHGVYGDDDFDSWGLSHGGEFASGFGVIPEAMRPALLWTWEHCVAGRQFLDTKPDWLAEGEASYDILLYPHRALTALINWPIDEQAVNPATCLPHVVVDELHGYIIARNRWQDADDSIVSLAFDKGPRGYYHFNQSTASFRVWALGLRTALPVSYRQAVVRQFDHDEDGSFRFSCEQAGQTNTGLVDISGRAAAVVAMVSGTLNNDSCTIERQQHCTASAHFFHGQIGDEPVCVLVVYRGASPQISLADNQLQVGLATYAFQDGRWLQGNY